VSAAVCLVLAAALVLPAAAAAAAPEFSLAITHSSIATPGGPIAGFKSGEPGYYMLTITNTGDAPTSGPITLTDTLPAGMTLTATTPGAFFSCTGDGTLATPLSCTRTQPLAPTETDSVQLDVLPVISGFESPTLTNTATVSGGGAAAGASAEDPALVVAPWAIKSFTSRTTNEAEADYTAAGGHPFQNRTAFEFTSHPRDAKLTDPNEELKDASVTLEPGFIGNPAAAPRCPIGDIGSIAIVQVPDNRCPPGSRVGTAFAGILGGGGGRPVYEVPIYNIITERGYPAQFAFRVANTTTILSALPLPRSESYGLTIGALNTPTIRASSFDTVFCSYGASQPPGASCNAPSASTGAPFLSNPLDCSNPQPAWNLLADSWENPGTYTAGGLPDLADPAWLSKSITSPQTTGCDNPLLASQFNSTTIATKPLQPGGGPVQADSPAGLAVDLDFPQSNDPTDLGSEAEPETPQAPEPKDITVKLPAGLSISPSSADGLQACSDLASDPAGDQVHYDSIKPVTCPDSSKIGSAVATSPLLAQRDPQNDKVVGPEPIPGDVYLLAPHPGDLPVGGGSQEGKFRLLIQLESGKAGVNIKLPGVATADPHTGQLTAVFTENPQLPASHITVSLKQGARAPLATPVTCGKFDTSAHLVPWGSPGVPDAHPTASFNVGSGPGGTGCPASAAARPFAPALVTAGPDSPVAGAHSPFTLKLTRADGEQEISSFDLTTPPGFSAKLAGVPYCSEAAIAAASGRSGAAELSSPSCPAASQLGTVTVAAGPGTNPYNTQGKAYLAGPYKGAPLSMETITPAIAGPFDLGVVAVRAALYVNPETAQVTVKTDQLPTILDGVPLKLRSITARIDRQNFTLNPTNCSPMSVTASVAGSNGATAHPSSSFQVGDCKALGFKPDLKLSLKGGTKRSKHPALKATLTYPKGNYANIATAVVSLPHSEFLAQNHIKTICTRVQFAADQCPAGSIYGYVTATTPLLDKPLEGPLYLRSSSHPLPDLVAALHGQIDVDLVGRIDSKNGGIRTTFDAVPDAPVSKFVLTMQGGKKGLLENSKNLCASVNKADVKFTAQNGKTSNSTPVLTNSCKKHGKSKGAKKHAKRGGHKANRLLLLRFGF
jgi:uncharacterized repeat protein (TIGR01451 family)